MLVFHGGIWHTVELPFIDPMLSNGHLQYAASIVIRERLAGKSEQEAITIAETAMYSKIFKGRGETA
jgi:hypothetical protein